MAQQVVLITGALTGIGRATAVAYAKLGAKIVVSGRHEDAGAKLRAELEALGAAAEFVKADVRSEEDVRSLVTATLARFGRLDVAVNNAGIEGEQGRIPEQTVDNFHTTFDTNVLGTLLCLKYELPVMLEQRKGSIINISSIAGKIGFAGASVYTASKHAVNGLTKSAALEAASSGVRVNAIAPGPIQTDMMERFVGRDANTKSGFLNSVPAGRAGTAEEIADAVIFLGSDKAAYFNGQAILVDGGYTTQ
jgi:NAD(P)-dependent dehydrogenase (short-subunit alcohol dehydrogenase family)